MVALVVLAFCTLVSSFKLQVKTNVHATPTLQPEKGDKIPADAKTYPGCGCTWSTLRNQWACEGTIAYPEEVQGLKCGCCGLNCQTSNRKSDEECLAGGFDQKAEMAAERKRLAELLKGADLLIGDDLPGFIVTVPDHGECTNDLLVKACKLGKNTSNGEEKDLTPICDHTSYATTGRCYTPGYNPSNVKTKKFWHKHFSHYTSHRAVMGLDVDDEIFYGMCFFTNNGRHTLLPDANGHAWSQSTNNNIDPRPGLSKPSKPVPVAKMNDWTGELGPWRTICVKEEPNKGQVHR